MKVGALVHDPGGRSLRKAGRTAVVMSASFLIGLHVVHNSQFAVVAAFSAAAVLGIADFAGTRTQRLQVTALTLGAGAVLLAIGTAVSTDTAAASTTMFVVTLVVSFSAVFSGYFAAASSAVIVFYVVATGVEGPASVIAPREAGLAFGGALSLLAAGWLWPSRGSGASRAALARVYRTLSEEVGALGTGGDRSAQGRSSPPGAPDEDRLGDAILEAERAVSASAWRPDGLARPHKARMYMLQGARRIAGLLEAFGRVPLGAVSGLEDVTGRLVAELARELELCSEGVATAGQVLPEPSRIEAAKVRFTTEGHRRFAEALAAGEDPGRLRAFAAWYFVVQQLCWATNLASIHCRAMHDAPLGASTRSEHSALVSSLSDGRSAAKWMRRARRNLTPRSVHLQNSLRLAAGLALARLAVGLLGLQHGFWVGFATLVVLKTSAAGTRSTALQAIFGTAVGFAVSSALITTFGVNAVVYSVVLLLAVFAAFYLPAAVSFVAGQACFTMVIVILFNLLKPAGWTVGLVRLTDVLVGAAIGLAIGLAIWPRGASSELSGVVGRLFVVGGGYAEATLRRLLGQPVEDHRSVDRGPMPRDDLGAAAVDAEDVFSQYLAEPHQSDAPVMAWAALIATAHRLWFGSSLVALVPEASGAARDMPEACDRLLSRMAELVGGYRDLARELAGEGGRVVLGAPGPDGAAITRPSPDATMTLLELEAWLAELALDLEGTGPPLDELGLSRSPEQGEGRDVPVEGSAAPQRAGGVA